MKSLELGSKHLGDYAAEESAMTSLELVSTSREDPEMEEAKKHIEAALAILEAKGPVLLSMDGQPGMPYQYSGIEVNPNTRTTHILFSRIDTSGFRPLSEVYPQTKPIDPKVRKFLEGSLK